MASVILPRAYCARRDLPGIRQAEYRLAVDSGKYSKAIGLLPPASRSDGCAQLWGELAPAQRPSLLADLLANADQTLPQVAMFAGFLATALTRVREGGRTITDCPASLRAFEALPLTVICWRAAEAG
jgi:hypothetical protein